MTILTWNIKVDLPWIFPRWKKREAIYQNIFKNIRPDIVCIQEALQHQVDFFGTLFPTHKQIGVGRDDGKEKGEYCACFYNAELFECIKSGTFWLSETPDVPSAGFDVVPRICTWGTFRMRETGNVFHLFNTHLPLLFNKLGREKAVRVIFSRMRPLLGEPVLLVGDFNSRPKSLVRGYIREEGFREAGDIGHTQTLFRMPFGSIDAIFVSKKWSVRSCSTLSPRKGLLRASDHLGVITDVQLK